MSFRGIFIILFNLKFLTLLLKVEILFYDLTAFSDMFTFNTTIILMLTLLWNSKVLFLFFFFSLDLLLLMYSGLRLNSRIPNNLIYKLLVIMILNFKYFNYFNFMVFTPINFLNNEDLNYLLLNTFNNIHPPMLYFSFLILNTFGYIINQSSVLKKSLVIRLVFGTKLSIMAITLGSWWAALEANWGGWWNWDPSESISLLVFFGFMRLLHLKLKNPNHRWFYWDHDSIVVNIAYLYIMIQVSFVDTSHSFIELNSEIIDSLLMYMKLISCGAKTHKKKNKKMKRQKWVSSQYFSKKKFKKKHGFAVILAYITFFNVFSDTIINFHIQHGGFTIPDYHLDNKFYFIFLLLLLFKFLNLNDVSYIFTGLPYFNTIKVKLPEANLHYRVLIFAILATLVTYINFSQRWLDGLYGSELMLKDNVLYSLNSKTSNSMELFNNEKCNNYSFTSFIDIVSPSTYINFSKITVFNTYLPILLMLVISIMRWLAKSFFYRISYFY